MQLLLVRHAHACTHAPSDHERSLSDQGIAAAKKLNELLNNAKVKPSLIICSDATRTQQTLAALDFKTSASLDIELILSEIIYTANDTLELLQEIEKHIVSLPEHPECVAVIGHNPTISLLAEILTNQPVQFLPADALLVETDHREWVVSLALEGTWRISKAFKPLA